MPEGLAPIDTADLVSIIETQFGGGTSAANADEGGSDGGGAQHEALGAADELDTDGDLLGDDDAAGADALESDEAPDGDDLEDDEADADGADAGAGLTWVGAFELLSSAISNPASIEQAPEALRPMLTAINGKFRESVEQAQGRSYTDGLDAGLEMAELIELYETDRDAWQERVDASQGLERSFHRLYAGIKERGVARRESEAGAAAGGDADAYRTAATQTLAMLSDYPDARARVLAKANEAGLGADEAGLRQLSEWTREEYAAALRAENEADEPKQPSRRARNAARLRNLPKPDVGGRTGASPTDRLAKVRAVDLHEEGSGASLFRSSLTELLSK